MSTADAVCYLINLWALKVVTSTADAVCYLINLWALKVVTSLVGWLFAAYTRLLLSDCIQDMKKEYEANCGLPITDDSQSLQRFCLKLEHLLQIGLRGGKPANSFMLYFVERSVCLVGLFSDKDTYHRITRK